jgi:hypothetical protein
MPPNTARTIALAPPSGRKVPVLRFLVFLPLVASACSVFPSARKTQSVIESVQAEYEFGVGTPRAIEVPASSDAITILELEVQPAPRGERFERGHRILLLPHDCARASLRCRVQLWSNGEPLDLSAHPSGDLFPGAASVRFGDEPAP